jgi:hypothetical protein
MITARTRRIITATVDINIRLSDPEIKRQPILSQRNIS